MDSLSVFFKLLPFAERLGEWLRRKKAQWLGRRTPQLYVHPILSRAAWCVAQQGASELIQFTFCADLTHIARRLLRSLDTLQNEAR
jgi:hypothetical protein